MLEILNKGGIFMWILFVVSILSFAVILERFYTIRRKTFLTDKGLKGKATKIKTQQGYEKTFVFLKEEIEKLARPNLVLSISASVSPLLGLLGTVSGMIKVFMTISSGGLGNPEALASGISEALFTTAAGLVIAIPAFIAFKFFQARIRLYSIILENMVLDKTEL